MPKSSKFVNFRAVREAVSMEDILRHYAILEPMKRTGDNLSGCCPIHKGSNPTQFRVSLQKNLWRRILHQGYDDRPSRHCGACGGHHLHAQPPIRGYADRKSTRLNSSH